MRVFGNSWVGGWLVVAGVATASLFAVPSTCSAQQYFGRNKVQYDNFHFKVLQTPHFDFYYYPVEADMIEDVARMGERWYERYARAFQHEFEGRKPVIVYADNPDFEQTNTVSGALGQGTEGVTEGMKNRVVIAMQGSYFDTNHVLGHELVHAFQYNIAEAQRGGGLQGMSTMPTWLVEGMAEYMSLGRNDPLTAMWIRDALRTNNFPTIKQLTRDTRFFPYRFGQALLAYIGGTYGDDAVIQIYRRALRVGYEAAIQQVLGMPADTLSVRWKDQVAKDYLPLMKGRKAPNDQGQLLFAPGTGAGASYNISPAVSPDGRYVAFLANKDLFSVDLYLADARTGKIIRKLASANTDPHADALRYIDSSGTFSPDGQYFAFVVVAGGANQLVIVRTDNGQETQRVTFKKLGSLMNPAWSPDGKKIAFSGEVGGISDLYLYDLTSGQTTQLTHDRYADYEPAWSPDGKTIAFTSDRGPQTNFQKLTFSAFQLALLDVATDSVTVVPVFGDVKHINPQYTPDGKGLYFISDQDGFSEIYRLDLATGSVRRITDVDTGVSGITYTSPAMSVAAHTGRIVYSVFDSLQFHIFGMDPGAGTAVVKVDHPETQPGRMLPPVNLDRFSRVATYLADANTGLVPPNTYPLQDAKPYKSHLGLDYVGQPTLGVGTDNFGNYVGGGASAFFSDMLGNHLLGVALQAQGTFKDIGGQAYYADLSRRWNWAVGGGRIPYMMGYYNYGSDANGNYLGLYQFRIFQNQLAGEVDYPFSTTRRIQFSAGLTRYSYDLQVDKYYVDQIGNIVGYSRQSLNDSVPAPVNMAQASVALIGDNSMNGFVGPVRGGRYHLEVGYTAGSVHYTTVIADWRRYFSPTKNLSFAMRALHYGRYGLNDYNNNQGFGLLQPLFLGYEDLVRGYAYTSFSQSECVGKGTGGDAGSTCPTFSRLFGNEIAVVNLEARIPLIGVKEYGLINFPFVPTQLVLFTDGGVAWDAQHPATLEWSRSGTARVPVFSSGVAARFNVLGLMVLQVYYAYPWQRPLKGWNWGFEIAPAW
ncbi:MAG: peptidase S9 [Gemmatimonadetes bacterium]|nr:peptidase S9 [Gemmatimonadota bacterium]